MIEQNSDRGWRRRFPKNLAWDIFTLDCILVTVFALLAATIASTSDRASQWMADAEAWLLVGLATMGIIALMCLLRLAVPNGGVGLRKWNR